MIKFTVLYNHPTDPAAFEKYYADVHLRTHLKNIAHLERFEHNKVLSTDGSQPPYYRTVDLWFKDLAAFQASLGSPGTQAVVQDIGNFATGGFTTLLCENTDVPV